MLLLEATAVAPDNSTVTLTAGTGTSYMTSPTENPSNQAYPPRLVHALRHERYCWASNSTSGRTTISSGSLELANGDGGLDAWLGYAVDGLPFTIRRGTDSVGEFGAYPNDYPVLFSGTSVGFTPSWGSMLLATTDGLGLVLDLQLQQTKFLGTNIGAAGVEGLITDLRGQPKPKLRGWVQNFQAIVANSIALIYQVDDGTAVLPMTLTVYVGGFVVTPGVQRTSLADLFANTPGTASYDWYAGPDGWYFRMGFTAGLQITCDCSEGTAQDRTTAQIVKRVLSNEGGINLANILGVAELDSVQNGEVGNWTADQTTVGAFLDPILASGNCYITDNTLGQVKLGRLEDPETQTSVVTFSSWQIMAPQGLQVSLGQDQGVGLRVGTVGLDNHVTNAAYANQGTAAGLPVWRVLLDYAQNHTVQNQTAVPALATSGAAGAVRAAMLLQSCATVEYDDPTGLIKQRHLKAPEYGVQSVFRYQVDAQVEAIRQFNLRGRQNVIVQVPLSPDDGIAVDLGQTFTLAIPRFGWDSGRKFFCIGIIYDGGATSSAQMMTLIGWGKL